MLMSKNGNDDVSTDSPVQSLDGRWGGGVGEGVIEGPPSLERFDKKNLQNRSSYGCQTWRLFLELIGEHFNIIVTYT